MILRDGWFLGRIFWDWRLKWLGCKAVKFNDQVPHFQWDWSSLRAWQTFLDVKNLKENCWDYEMVLFIQKCYGFIVFWWLVKYGESKCIKAANQNKPRCFFSKQGWLEGSHDTWSKVITTVTLEPMSRGALGCDIPWAIVKIWWLLRREQTPTQKNSKRTKTAYWT